MSLKLWDVSCLSIAVLWLYKVKNFEKNQLGTQSGEPLLVEKQFCSHKYIGSNDVQNLDSCFSLVCLLCTKKQLKIETKQLGTLSGNPFGDKSIHFGRSLKVHQNS